MNGALRHLTVGTQLELLEHRLRATQQYASTLIGWKPETFIIVDVSSASPESLDLPLGATLHARFERSSKLFAFETRVLSLEPKPCPLLFLSYPSLVKELAMRRHRRMRATIPVTIFSVLTNEGTILDLSEGGALVHTDTEIPPGSTVFLSFTLPNGDRVEHCKCWVRHTKPATAQSGYQLGLEFVDIENSFERRSLQPEPGYSVIG